MSKRPSLVRQIQDTLWDKCAMGQSKHKAKADGTAQEHIYSYNTYRTYMRHCNYFVRWCAQNAPEGQKLRTMEDCRPYAAGWLQSRIDAEYSPYTIKLQAAALCKLYGASAEDLGLPRTPTRHRADITRSRGTAVRDADFSAERNQEIISFCKCTGLRRRELATIRGTDLVWGADGKAYIHVIHGKGGRERDAVVLDNDPEVITRMQAAGDDLVWPRIPSHMDVHGYRADYATALYNRVARDVSTIPPAEQYHCRGDRAGVVYDRMAMLYVSRALGHNRISVIAGHYLHD